MFQFVEGPTIPDHMVITISTADAFHLGVLSSDIHITWSLIAGGTLEDRPRYNKVVCFDTFPFPAASPAQEQAVRDLAEELESTRRLALDEVPGLTLTELYNLRESLRTGKAMDLVDRGLVRASRAAIINRLHEQLNEAVSAAYGWPSDLPSVSIVTRLVELNAQRAAEEAQGTVRWLRPEYQQARFDNRRHGRVA